MAQCSQCLIRYTMYINASKCINFIQLLAHKEERHRKMLTGEWHRVCALFVLQVQGNVKH
jgi:hypothetical protein